jgi:hypothetical protein
MAYVIEIDDSHMHIVYPPRGMEFEPVQAAPAPAQSPQEKKSPWHQEELAFAFDSTNQCPTGLNGKL